MSPLAVLALSGSLRKASLNTAMLTMAADCAPAGLRVEVHRGLGELPLFNPELDMRKAASVMRLRHAIAGADALLIASPEYAHGVSGVMKNALDWMVATGVFVAKPVVLWNASPRSSHALAALRETLTVMSSRMIDEASLGLLIKLPEAGAMPVNPAPEAMRHALLVLREILCSERLGVGPDLKFLACAAP
ncbi:MAG: NADPH-dependent FMN reductase [Caldimonas sp.]